MNKTDLILAVSEKTGLAKKDADKAVNAVISTVMETLAKDEKVQIVGFGTFEVRSVIRGRIHQLQYRLRKSRRLRQEKRSKTLSQFDIYK